MARDRLVNPIEIAKISTPGTDSGSGFTLLYPKTDGFLYMKDGAGTERQIGPLTFSSANKTTTYAPTRTEGIEVIRCDASGGAFNVNLPTVVSNKAIFIIVKIDSSANAVTVDGNTTETIAGGLTAALTRQYESITLFGDNSSNWDIT